MENIDYNKIPGEILENEVNVTDEKLITIITKINNIEEQSIIKLYNSLKNQTFPYWKWMIQVSNNIDSIKQIIQKDERVEICKNIDIEDIETEFIVNASENVVFDATYLECGYFSLVTNKEAAFAYSNYILIDKNETRKDMFSSATELERNIVPEGYIIRTEILKKLEETDNIWNTMLQLLEKDMYPIKMNFYGIWLFKENSYVKSEHKTIKNNILGINYPVSCEYLYDTFPYEFDWKHKKSYDNGKKNILFIFPWMQVGGADKFNYNLVSQLDQDKYNISIILTEDCPYIWRQKFEQYAEIFDLTTFLHREHWAGFIEYIIKTRNINLVMQSNSYYGYYVIPWLKSKCPEVIFTDYLHAINWNWRNGEYPRDSVAISNLLDETFVSSKVVYNGMKEIMNRKKENVKIAYVGVDEKKFNEENVILDNYKQIIKYKEKYKNKKIILFCSRISEEKRPLLAIEVLKELKREDKNIILFVVGDGPQLEEMREKVIKEKLENNIIFFGVQDDVRPFYKLSNVLLICSLREGITTTTYEALSMKTPVVSADVGGQAELIDNSCGRLVENLQNENNGMFNRNYEKKEIQRYTEAIKEVIYNEDFENLRENARRKIEGKFTVDNLIKTLDKEFTELIENGTKVRKELCENEQLYSQYLLLYNEIDRRYYNSSYGGVIEKKEEINEDEIIAQKLNEEKTKLEQEKEELKSKLKENEKILQLKNDELEKIYNSKSWKYTRKLVEILKPNFDKK